MAKFEILKLKEKYGNFAYACYTIKINGKELDQYYCKGGIKIELSAKYEASSCTLSINNGFLNDNNEKMKINKDIKNLLKLGNKIEAFVGYRNSGLSSVFVGYIDSLYIDYDKDEGIVYTVECLDGKGIMMNSLHSENKTSMKKYSEAVEAVIKKYSSLIKINMSNFDKSDGEAGVFIEQHNESDYNFVVRMAKKLNYCFYIEKGNLLFKPIEKLSKEVQMIFDINYYMLDFKMTASLKGQVSGVNVVGNNEKDPTKPFTAKVSQCKSIAASASVKNKASVISKDVYYNVVDVTVDSVEKAKKVAEASLTRLSRGLYQGSVKMVGIPEIFPGNVVQIQGFGKEFDNKYFVSSVIHQIRNEKFTTQCNLEVNGL